MAGSWPDTPFEESMLVGGNGVIVHCPDRDLVEDLFEIFCNNGVGWIGLESLSTTYWDNDKNKTCYRITNDRKLRVGNIYIYDQPVYDGYIKCTFYGADTEDYEINEEGFMALFEAGGE